MADYDISEAFQRIEEEMIASMSRNLKRHLRTEDEEGLNYTMWQAEQLKALNNFKKNNKKLFKSYFSTINGKIDEILRKANETGRMTQEVAILEAIKNGYARYSKNDKSVIGEFFKINERKLNALIKATTNDMKKGETAMLRRVNDEYRKIIYNAEVYYNTGVGTLPQAVDMATKDFLSRGISCIEYSNGARVGIDSYAKMALRTAQTRAYLLGEATKRDEWGISTVIVNKRGVACPMCLKYVGKVFYDDVWGNAPIPSPAEYPLLSEAIKGGLYHPNCKDVHTTYFEGINTPPEPMTEEEKKEAARVYNLEQQQRYNERQIRKYKRLSDGSVDPENRDRYYKKLSEWQETQKNFVKANGDVLKRRYENESIHGIGPIDNKDTRRTVAQMKREVALEKIQNSKTKDLTNAGNGDIIGTDSSKTPRGMANGGRRSPFHVLTEDEIKSLREDIKAIKADPTCFAFNSGSKTSYDDRFDIIYVTGDVLPDLDSLHPRDLMSARATLAHEYYGHRAHKDTKLQSGSWNDEFRASYTAAIKAPGLSDEDRRYLILDALERARESGVSIRYNKNIRRILYGKEIE